MHTRDTIQLARKLEVPYNRNDVFLRKELRLTLYVPFKELVKRYKEKNVWWRDDDFLHLIASIRNILVHTKRESGYIVMPSEELVEQRLQAEKKTDKASKGYSALQERSVNCRYR